MSDSSPESITPDDWSGFDSRDCVIIFSDGPGDTTVRPCRPELLPYLLAERERLARWGEQIQRKPPSDEPADE
jgi:hypothetical protein